MQNKGFVKVFAVLLTLVCIYYLSFSVVTSRYESRAAQMSPEAGQRYLDSMKNESVWMFKTLQECQEYQLGLGLDLKGGMNVTLEVSVPDIIKVLAADNADDPMFVKAFATASEEALSKCRRQRQARFNLRHPADGREDQCAFYRQ